MVSQVSYKELLDKRKGEVDGVSWRNIREKYRNILSVHLENNI